MKVGNYYFFGIPQKNTVKKWLLIRKLSVYSKVSSERVNMNLIFSGTQISFSQMIAPCHL